MRRIFFSLLVFLLLCFSVNAQEYDYCAGAGGAACTQTKLHSQETVSAAAGIGITSSAYRASSYTAGTNDPIRTLYLLLDRDGATDNTSAVTAYLCPDNEGTPGTPPNISTCTAADSTIAHNTLSADAAYAKFNWAAGYAQTASTTYWIVVHFAYVDGTTFINWSYNNTVDGQTVWRDDNGVPAYIQVDTSGQCDYKAYNCLE